MESFLVADRLERSKAVHMQRQEGQGRIESFCRERRSSIGQHSYVI